MNGAHAMVKTLLANDLEVCFTNPGTSEMHFVAALDDIPGMRCVLGLFEGVVTGAADGYARMAEKPAATLLHLGPGFANGMANIHNARKARSPMVNIVGEHASYHLEYESPLRSDIQSIAGAASDWVRTSTSATSAAQDSADAVAAARSGGKISTLILPANMAWDESTGPAEKKELRVQEKVDAAAIETACQHLRSGKRCAILITGPLLREPYLTIAGQIAESTGARLLAQQSNARTRRGRGHVSVERIPYPVHQALKALADVEVMILIGANAPASFFAYPNQANMMTPSDCETITLAGRDHDQGACLQALSDALNAQTAKAPLLDLPALALPSGDFNASTVVQAVAALLPENAILCDESVTSGRDLFTWTAHSNPHDHLQLTGGAIGIGAPLATGAAIACPERPVVTLQADGSGMYTLQALWTQAREQLNVTTVIFANRSYKILQGELRSVGVDSPGETAQKMLSLDNPAIDWVSLARGMGVSAVAVDNNEALIKALRHSLDSAGPSLIEAVIA